MVTIPLGTTDFRRSVSRSPFVRLRNRYFEANPTNQVEQMALLTRPALQRWLSVGSGPIRGIYSQPGSFFDALFVVSGNALYKVNGDASVDYLGGGLFPTNEGFASMAATAAIGSTPEMLYLADGQQLYLYMQDSYAQGELFVPTTSSIIAGDQVRVGDIYYQFTAGSVDAGAPAGTLANPWLLALGVDTRGSLAQLAAAINATGTQGVNYSTGLLTNPLADALGVTSESLTAQADEPGLAGNNVIVSTTIAGASWSGGTFGGGAGESFNIIDLPDGLAAVAVAFIAGYVIVIPKATQGFNGRFFWIEPGETIIRPLNFATAERSPDPVFSVRVVGDQFWLLGKDTSELWYPTGVFEAPFVRVQGQTFDNGIIEGTDSVINNTVFLVDENHVVYILAGGAPKRVSDNAIEERIRRAVQAQS